MCGFSDIKADVLRKAVGKLIAPCFSNKAMRIEQNR